MTSDISRYELGDLLGLGTVGTIYSARDTETGDQVALKKLHPQVSASPLIRARFKREMLILERLRHPNIVSYLDRGRDDRILFYTMEQVGGGTVKDLLESGPLAWETVLSLTIQLCSAMQCAHNLGIVHRDIKPSNLFLTSNGELKLGDFGIARDLTTADITEAGFAVGTHAYMAPEQIRGELTVSAKTDLYALGCCLYEMLTGEKPFSGESYTQLFDQHLKSPPPRVRDSFPRIPQEIDEVVHQLLEKEPNDRPFNARQVQVVMLRLAESASHAADQPDHESVQDVRESPILQSGREDLVQRIRERKMRPVQEDVSFTRLFVVLAVILIFAAVAYFVA